jgi:hypothetical protein
MFFFSARQTFYHWAIALAQVCLLFSFLGGEFFIFYLSYINNTGGFHCDNSIHAYNVLWTSSLLPLYSRFPSPSSLLFQIVFGGFHYSFFTCMYAVCFYPLQPSISFPYHHFLLFKPPQIVPHIHSCPVIIIIILGLGSTNEWKYGIFGLLSLTYFTQHDDLFL